MDISITRTPVIHATWMGRENREHTTFPSLLMRGITMSACLTWILVSSSKIQWIKTGLQSRCRANTRIYLDDSEVLCSLLQQNVLWDLVSALPFTCCVSLVKSPPVSGLQLSLENERAALDGDFLNPVTNSHNMKNN